jgi:hypothetical protein
MRSGQPQVLAQKIDEQGPRLDFRLPFHAVDSDGYGNYGFFRLTAHGQRSFAFDSQHFLPA